ncbi:MAG: hypothetical protein KA116_01415 [Proteobacteria bacterium]|nr:hypothetical protein [Pseudomonadota bacterium]
MKYFYCLFVLMLAQSFQAQALSEAEVKTMQIETMGSLSCPNFRSQVFDLAYKFLRTRRSPNEFKSFPEIFNKITFNDVRQWSYSRKAQLPFLRKAFRDLYLFLFLGHRDFKKDPGGDFRLDKISAAELGDRTSEAADVYLNHLDYMIESMKVFALNNAIDCATEMIPEPQQSAVSPTLASKGARKTLDNFYQTCDAMSWQPYGLNDPDVEGIKVVGQHPSGGNKRIISDKEKLLSTHFYLKSVDSYGMLCVDVKKNPPIYDFGGKPNTSNGILDFFSDAGSGTSVMGIDCSAVVFSSLATMGMKLKSDTKLKPEHVHGVSSSMFKEPQDNGLTCLSKLKPSATDHDLQPGDIIAIKGHVVIVESIESDPWGINRFVAPSQCSLENISSKNFNFIIIQSSPVKGGIGVNRMNAREYFQDGQTMADGLRANAVNACLARLGSSKRIDVSKASVVRHKGTSNCTDDSLKLSHESCTQNCRI